MKPILQHISDIKLPTSRARSGTNSASFSPPPQQSRQGRENNHGRDVASTIPGLPRVMSESFSGGDITSPEFPNPQLNLLTQNLLSPPSDASGTINSVSLSQNRGKPSNAAGTADLDADTNRLLDQLPPMPIDIEADSPNNPVTDTNSANRNAGSDQVPVDLDAGTQTALLQQRNDAFKIMSQRNQRIQAIQQYIDAGEVSIDQMNRDFKNWIDLQTEKSQKNIQQQQLKLQKLRYIFFVRANKCAALSHMCIPTCIALYSVRQLNIMLHICTGTSLHQKQSCSDRRAIE